MQVQGGAGVCPCPQSQEQLPWWLQTPEAAGYPQPGVPSSQPFPGTTAAPGLNLEFELIKGLGMRGDSDQPSDTQLLHPHTGGRGSLSSEQGQAGNTGRITEQAGIMGIGRKLWLCPTNPGIPCVCMVGAMG